MRKLIFVQVIFLSLLFSVNNSFGQDHGHTNHDGHNHGTHEQTSHDDHSGHNHGAHQGHGDAGHDANDHSGHGHGQMICGRSTADKFDVTETAMHHIGDANVYSIGPLQLPLPCMLYSKDAGMEMFSSSKFKAEKLGHGDGKIAHNRYVLVGGRVKRIEDKSFPSGDHAMQGYFYEEEMINGKERNVWYACDGKKAWKLEAGSTADGGIFGGGITSFTDFSLTKNVTSMLLVCLFLAFTFFRMASYYKKNEGKAPKGVTSFFEPIIVFIRDEVAKPFLGAKWEKYFSFLLAIFFFILGLNLFGQIPFFGGSNVTGNLAVTLVLAVLAFLVTNLSGNAHYWKHQLLAPGIPWFVKPILIPVEIMGLFIKPLTLMLRLFANITAGHIVLIVFVSLIFIFGKSGESAAGAYGASIGSTLLTLFMMALELIVALVQAFVFTMLTASYIGAATEEVEHH